jgi:hypothetical protein
MAKSFNDWYDFQNMGAIWSAGPVIDYTPHYGLKVGGQQTFTPMNDIHGDCPECGEPMVVESEYSERDKQLMIQMGHSEMTNTKRRDEHMPGSSRCMKSRIKNLERDIKYLKDFIDNKLQDSEDL